MVVSKSSGISYWNWLAPTFRKDAFFLVTLGVLTEPFDTRVLDKFYFCISCNFYSSIFFTGRGAAFKGSA